MKAEDKQALIEWLKPQINELENISDEIPFGLDVDSEMHLNTMCVALDALTAQPVAIVEPRDHLTAAQLVGEEPMSKAVRPLFEGALALGQTLYTAPPAPAVSLAELVPDGWQLVPVEPTEEMIAAGDQFMDGLSRLGSAYDAMLAAAPEVE